MEFLRTIPIYSDTYFYYQIIGLKSLFHIFFKKYYYALNDCQEKKNMPKTLISTVVVIFLNSLNKLFFVGSCIYKV